MSTSLTRLNLTLDASMLGLLECRVVSRDRTTAIAELGQKLANTRSGGELVRHDPLETIYVMKL